MSRRLILVADDSAITRTVVVRTLERAGFEVLQAEDGAAAAVIAMRERPDVVVTDLEMPLMSGVQLLRLLKSDPSTATIPIAIFTSHGEAPSRFWGLATGADAYLTKDYDADALVATVARLVQLPHEHTTPSVTAPLGPLDVLARVAQQLDRSLLRATLATTLFERAVAAATLHEASRILLATIAEVVDAPILGIALAEPETVTLHLHLTQAVSLRAVEGCSSRLLEAVAVTPGATVDAAISGVRDGDGDVDSGALTVFSLPLRGASGVLTVLPRETGGFDAASRPLIEGLLPTVALLADNARLTQRLHELSSYDGLTRLLNHRAVYERLEGELSRARRFGHSLAVVIADLDLFKRVNDEHGHLAGDAVLRAAATALRNSLRTADVLGRYGGEEFLAVLPETNLEAGRRAAERLRGALAEHPVPLPSGVVITMTGSFGVAASPEVDAVARPDVLVSLADSRLYQAKAAGRNCVRP